MTDLQISAYKLANEIWDNKWDYVADQKSKPVPECVEIIDELHKRCPGYTLEQYKKAIGKAIFEQR